MKSTGHNRIIAFACTGSSELAELTQAGASVVEIRCVGQLPPSFIDYVLSRGHADGVMLAGCLDGACKHRYGTAWTEQRIARQRDPRLRKRVNNARIACGWQHPWKALGSALKIHNAFALPLDEEHKR